MSGVEFRNVSKRYGSDTRAPLVVQGIDFRVPKGTLTTILGPSGCGKTTLLRMMAGLDAPTQGAIWIDGVDVTLMGPAQRNVSMMFQSYALFPHMTVLANVGYGLRMSGVPPAQTQQGWWASISACPASCRAGSSNAWPWPVLWCWSPRCCCLTSR
jgi:iron(III) transport system ATP-binding protein